MVLQCLLSMRYKRLRRFFILACMLILNLVFGLFSGVNPGTHILFLPKTFLIACYAWSIYFEASFS